MGLRLSIAVSVAGLSFATAATAALFSFGFSGNFSGAEIETSEAAFIEAAANELEWGRSAPSSLTITPGDYTGDITDSTSIELGEFVWRNKSSL